MAVSLCARGAALETPADCRGRAPADKLNDRTDYLLESISTGMSTLLKRSISNSSINAVLHESDG